MKNGQHPFGAIERLIESWWRNIPHLPKEGQRWLARNSWWIAIIGLVLLALGFLQALDRAYILTTPQAYLAIAVGGYIGWSILVNFVYLFFTAIEVILLAIAISPLREGTKKGWSLLFVYALVASLAIIVQALLTLSIFGFIITIIFGAIGMAIYAYFLFEIRDHFAHVVVAKTKTRAGKK